MSSPPAAGTRDRDDETLVARLRAEDDALARGALETLYRTYVDGLMVFAMGYVQSRAVAQDIVADLFVALWEHRTTVAPAHGIRAYLYSAARNRALNLLRDASRHEQLTLDASDESFVAGMGNAPRPIDEAVDIAQQIDLAFRAIATFPEPRRRILELRWRDGLTAAEIAYVLGVTRNAVDIHLTRALRLLKQMLPTLID